MSATGRDDRKTTGALTGWTVAFAVVATLAVVGLPVVHFAYPAPALHVSLETANAVIALLVAYLVYGRFRDSRRLQELLLITALCTVALANLVLTALPSAVTLARGEDVSRWGAIAIRFIGTLLFAGAALTAPAVRVHRRQAVAGVTALAGLLLVLGVAGLRYGDALPATVDPNLSLDDASRPVLAAHPVVLGVQAMGACLYSVAAVAFSRQAARTGDELMRWVGAGCVLAATARVHYLLYPSLYTEFVYTGDVLRLGFYLMLLVGAAREIRSYWEVRAHAAVLEDRRRMGRELHDGLAQELSYISAQSRRLVARPGDTVVAVRIRDAAGRAVDEARRAVTALTRPVDEPFPRAVQRLVDDLAHRYDVKIVTHLDERARVDPAQAEALLRIVTEAVGNAVRHGGASRVELRLTDSPVCMAVVDDGCGFDPATGRPGGFGLTSMRERAEGVCAEFDVTSTPGEGTTVRVTWR